MDYCSVQMFKFLRDNVINECKGDNKQWKKYVQIYINCQLAYT